jgi:predicted permease
MTRQTELGAEVVEPGLVLGPFFELLAVPPLLGRWIRAEETARGAAPRAVLGYGFWQSAFGGRADVIGESIDLNGSSVEIIGVMPQGFGLPSPEVALYLPMGVVDGLPWDDRISSFGARAFARLRPGVTLAEAQQDMNRVTTELEAEEGRPGARVEVITMREHVAGEARGPLLVLMGAVGFVLLIAGVNVANLLLVRGEGRRREMAMRLALGAGRGAIVKHLLTESALICALGGGFGLLLTVGVVAGLRSRLPLRSIVTEQITIDGTVLAFTAGLVFASALLFGLIPALRVTRTAPVRELREDGRVGESRKSQRLRSSLVTAELALALVLLVGAGLMLRSLGRLYDVDAGFESENVLTARVSLARGSTPDRERWIDAYERLVERIESEPAVTAAAATLLVPLASRSWEFSVAPEGEPYSRTEGASVLYNIVSQNYFEVMGIRLTRGRAFLPTDRNETPPVAIIDETMAERLWPNEDPIGKRIAFEEAEGSTLSNPIPVYRTVIGVVPNIRHYDVRSASRIQVYVPLRQTLETWGTSLSLAVRTESDAAAFAPVLRSAARDVDANIALTDMRTLEDYVAGDLGRDRALSSLLAGFGGVAAGLAAIGVFGVMSLLVTTREREMGVRLALGARPAALLGSILGRTMVLAGSGVALGLTASAALSRMLGAFLFEVAPLQPVVYAAAAALLIGVAFLAALVPAARAARVDPMTSLRQGA